MAGCNCPGNTSLTTVPDSDCPFDIKQIQKVVFQRRGYVWIFPTVNISLLPDWSVLLVAIDNTKVVSTPLIGGEPIITAGDAITEGGGDNSTLNGVENITGTAPSVFSCMFKSITPEQELALKELMCESLLDVYFITEDNKIVCAKLSGTERTGIHVQSLFVGDRNNLGFGTKDTNALRFSLPSGWSENIELIVPGPGFNPLVDL